MGTVFRFGIEKNSFMYSRLVLTGKYLRYCFHAANARGHGIHSPFVFDFVRNVLCDRTAYPAFRAIEGLRRQLLSDRTKLEVEDMGAGSAKGRGSVEAAKAAVRIRSVAEIARHAAKPARLGQLLYRMARYYRPGVAVELGTSLGLSSAYLASGMKDGNTDGKLWTIEGSASIAALAAGHLTGLVLENANTLTGNCDDRLEPLLDAVGPVEFAFVDGNHRYEPTLRYFGQLLQHAGNSALLVFDDIHWSTEMESAWERIRADSRVPMTIDLFHFGLVVIRESFKVKQHFAIRF